MKAICDKWLIVSLLRRLLPIRFLQHETNKWANFFFPLGWDNSPSHKVNLRADFLKGLMISIHAFDSLKRTERFLSTKTGNSMLRLGCNQQL